MGGCSLTIPLDTSTLAAQIKYLPKREEILKWSPEQVPYGLENNVFGHPVLIISPKVDKKGKVVVFPVSIIPLLSLWLTSTELGLLYVDMIGVK